MYLSYLMGGEDISDADLESLGIDIAQRFDGTDRGLQIPDDSVDGYRDLLQDKLTPGFWNEYLNEENIYFLFKFDDDSIKEYELSSENESAIDRLCAQFMGEPVGDEPQVYKFLFGNDYYRDFMQQNYHDKFER